MITLQVEVFWNFDGDFQQRPKLYWFMSDLDIWKKN